MTPDNGPWMDPKQVSEFQPPMPTKTDVVSDYEREVLGAHARLQIPLTHSRDLRRFADIIRGVANELDLLSRETVLPEYKILLRAKLETIGQANLKMKECTRGSKS
jgi:hypothetical protein